VLLVEVKSAIPTEPVRLGTPDAADAIVGKLGKAIDQIDVTAQLIADRDPALAAVPADRPVLGLAVTLEPFHIANAFSLLPAGRTPVTIADAAEIEALVTITDTPPGRLLLERRRQCPLHLVPGHGAVRARAQPEPDPGRGMELLPVGVRWPRRPLTLHGEEALPPACPAARGTCSRMVPSDSRPPAVSGILVR
jgi:hypothetical protein